MSKRNILIVGAVATVFITSVAFAQSARDAQAAKAERGDSEAEQTVQSDAERKAERRARNEAAAKAKPKAGKQKERVEEEEEERRENP